MAESAVLHAYAYLTGAEVRFLDAAVERLIPTDELGPGAKDAGVTCYIDRQLSGVWGMHGRNYRSGPWLEGTPEQGYQSRFTPQEVYRIAIREINDYCRSQHGKLFEHLPAATRDEVLKALEKGGVDGAVMTIPFVFIAEDRGFRVLVDMAETDIYYLHTMIASTRSYLKTNRDSAVRFLRGFVEGIAYFKQNKKESMEIVRKKLRINADQERNLERSYDLLASKYYEAIPYPSLRGVETVLGLVEKDNPKAKEADPKSFVDDSLLREIEQSGLIKSLYRK